ncbi:MULTISPECIES: ArnT family glycosyltransferase [Methylococcus]|uniref:Glycosyltransferase family 39 protein n=1 Tax=Methylococcus capsulatus TaxID=414 RepID=A0ABZ2F7Y9_METCP|nr:MULTISPECIES: glycosyltransferase family 39 protein [Methylococcus]MDF9393637.1 glycosyltransferase family 39 protein [Methylococcus capsulatus]
MSIPVTTAGAPAYSLERWLPAFAFLFAAFLLFVHLGDAPLLSPDEGRNAEVAREMRESGAWLVPTYDGLTYLDKPAFYFKTVALSFALFGESEAVARLSSALFALSLLTVLFLFCRRVYDTRTASLAVLVVAATPLYWAFARIVIFDMTLAFFVCSAIIACYLAEEYEGRQRERWYRVGALAAGFATLVKGPVGFIVPSLVVAAFNKLEGREGALRRCFAGPNWLIFLAVVLPWFVGVSLQCPDFPYYGIMKESVSRFTTTEFRRTQPFYFYAVIIASCFFAWSLLLPESIVAAWRARRRWSPPDRLFIVWAIVVVAFFSVSQSKLPGYILTAIVALGVLAARVFALAWANGAGRAAAIVQRGTVALFALAAPAAVVLATAASDALWLERVLGLGRKTAEFLQPGLLAMVVSLGVVTALAAFAWRRRNFKVAFAAFFSFPALLITLNFDLLADYADRRSGRRLAAHMPQLPAEVEIACLDCLPNGLPFYLKRLITVISDDGREFTSNYVLFSLHRGEPWPEQVVPLAQRDAWLAGRDHPVFVMARGDDVEQLDTIAEKYGASQIELGFGYWGALLAPSRKEGL